MATINRKECTNCGGTAVKLCPWCKIDTRDDKGNVISSRPGSGCRACYGKGIFTCTVCDGRGYLPQDEIVIPERDAQQAENTAK